MSTAPAHLLDAVALGATGRARPDMLGQRVAVVRGGRVAGRERVPRSGRGGGPPRLRRNGAVRRGFVRFRARVPQEVPPQRAGWMRENPEESSINASPAARTPRAGQRPPENNASILSRENVASRISAHARVPKVSDRP